MTTAEEEVAQPVRVNLTFNERAVRATDFLLGRDEWGANWIRRYREQQAAANA